MDDKTALKTSNAGMRLIAQQTLLNRGDTDRLRAFISESYSENALQSESVEVRLAALEKLRATYGKLKIMQVLATDKHHVVVLMQAQNSDNMVLHEMRVEEDYPHRITGFTHNPLEA